MDDYAALTCLTCRVAFADLDLGREHYKSEWHGYNLKRKVAQMEPFSADLFKAQSANKKEQVRFLGQDIIFLRMRWHR